MAPHSKFSVFGAIVVVVVLFESKRIICVDDFYSLNGTEYKQGTGGIEFED